jgi:hypothetical protein
MTEATPQSLPVTRQDLERQQRLSLAHRCFELENDVALLQQELAVRDRQIAEFRAAAECIAGSERKAEE